MKEDKTIARIRAARKKISARFGNDTKKLVKHYIEVQKKYKGTLHNSGSI